MSKTVSVATQLWYADICISLNELTVGSKMISFRNVIPKGMQAAPYWN